MFLACKRRRWILVQYILGYLTALGQAQPFPVQISEFVPISEEAINHLFLLSADNFAVVHSQFQHKTITMHTHTQHFVKHFIFTSLHRFWCCLSEAHFHWLHKCFDLRRILFVFDVAFWKPISIDYLNALIFDASFLMLATVDRAMHAPYFSAMTVYNDPASIDLIISSFLPIVDATFLCLAISAILRTTQSLKFNSLQHNYMYSTCAIKPRPFSDNQGCVLHRCVCKQAYKAVAHNGPFFTDVTPMRKFAYYPVNNVFMCMRNWKALYIR